MNMVMIWSDQIEQCERKNAELKERLARMEDGEFVPFAFNHALNTAEGVRASIEYNEKHAESLRKAIMNA